MVQPGDCDLARLNCRQISSVRADKHFRIVAPDAIGFLDVGFAVRGIVIYPAPVNVEPISVRPFGEPDVGNKMAGAIGNHWVGGRRPFIKVSADGNLLR